MTEKTLNITNPEQAKAAIPDIQIEGDPNAWVVICKASSKSQGWMKSTKALSIPGAGCLVQVSTQQRVQRTPYSDDYTNYVIAEALTFVPGVKIGPKINGVRELTVY